jgi:hypothetical protein
MPVSHPCTYKCVVANDMFLKFGLNGRCWIGLLAAYTVTPSGVSVSVWNLNCAVDENFKSTLREALWTAVWKMSLKP